MASQRREWVSVEMLWICSTTNRSNGVCAYGHAARVIATAAEYCRLQLHLTQWV